MQLPGGRTLSLPADQHSSLAGRLQRTDWVQLAGQLGGAQTQPALLAFANTRSSFDTRVSLGYALVYPAAMVGKIKAAKPDCIYSTVVGGSNVAFYKQLRAAGLDGTKQTLLSTVVSENEIEGIGKENAGRNPKRTAITSVALSIGVCLVVIVAIFAASIRSTVKSQLSNQLADVDLVVDSGTGFAGLGPEPRQFLEDQPEVDLINPIRFNQATLLDSSSATGITMTTCRMKGRPVSHSSTPSHQLKIAFIGFQPTVRRSQR